MTEPYQGQLLDHEIYRVTLSDRSKVAARVRDFIAADSVTIESDGHEWWFEPVRGAGRTRPTKEVYAWISRYLSRTYGLRHRGPRPETAPDERFSGHLLQRRNDRSGLTDTRRDRPPRGPTRVRPTLPSRGHGARKGESVRIRPAGRE